MDSLEYLDEGTGLESRRPYLRNKKGKLICGLNNVLCRFPFFKEGNWQAVFQEYINNTAVKAHP